LAEIAGFGMSFDPFRMNKYNPRGDGLKIAMRNSLESARQSVVRVMDKIGKVGWFFQIRIFPHHILRENPLAAGAGADRLSTGMAHNFGKPIGISAQLKAGQEVFTIHTTKERIPLARSALKKAAHKLPFQCSVTVEDINDPKKKPVIKSKPLKKLARRLRKQQTRR